MLLNVIHTMCEGATSLGLQSFPVPAVLKFYQHMRVSELNEIVGTQKLTAAQLS